MTATKSEHADLFDWLFINDHDLLANALEARLDDIFEKNKLEVTKRDHAWVECKKYNMIWNHLFETAISQIWAKSQGGQLTDERFDLAFPYLKKN